MPDLLIHPGTYGGLTSQPACDSINYSLVRDYGFDWAWFGHQGTIIPMMEGDEQVIRQLRDISEKARVILRLWPWSGARKGCDPVASLADPILNGKDWLDLADEPACFDASLRSMIRQIEIFAEHIGLDGLYGVSVSEEEPEVGMDYGRGFQAVDSLGYEGAEKTLAVYNRFFDALKDRFDRLRISPSFYPCFFDGRRGKVFTDEQFARIKRDFVIMDAYPNGEESLYRHIESWKKIYPPTTETYIILWGCGSVESIVPENHTIEGYSRLGREKDNCKILQTNEAFLQAGYCNLGWFGLGWPSPVRDQILAWADEHRAKPWSDKKGCNWRQMLTTRFNESKAPCEACLPLMSSKNAQKADKALKQVEESLLSVTDSFNMKDYKKTASVLWLVIGSILDEAGERAVRIDKALDFQDRAKIFDEFRGKLPDKKQMRLLTAKCSLIETVAEFFAESAPVDDIIDDMLSLIRNIASDSAKSSDTPESLRSELRAFCEAADSDDLDVCNSILKKAGLDLVKAGLTSKVFLQVVFGNPFSYPVDALPKILCLNNSDTWREIYHAKPLGGEFRRESTVEYPLDMVPSAVCVDNGNWTGSFRIHDVRIITGNEILHPAEVKTKGNVTNAHSLLEQTEEFAEIYHTGQFYEEDIVELYFSKER